MVRFPVAALLLLLAIAPCRADDMLAPESSKSLTVDLCRDDAATSVACKNASLQALARAVDAAAKAAIAKADARAAVLLKRDQVWFSEIVSLDEQNEDQNAGPEVWDKLAAALKRRRAALEEIAQGLGRTAIVGKWVNAFGSVEIAPAADGTLRATMATEARYGPDDVQQESCKASIIVRPDTDGWLAGDSEPSTPVPGDKMERARLRIRQQGETLRVLAGDEIHVQDDPGKFNCNGVNQITGSYFPAGQTRAARTPAPFTAPIFDCAHPSTASEEEICADPELAANDQRINRDWKALLPRLKPAMRQLLMEDQRAWIKTQAIRYPDALHLPSAKLSFFVHWTGVARDNLAAIQRERTAMLERYDETRRGFEGDWSAYNAAVSVYRAKDGKLHVEGNKWFEDDYKGGCDYDFTGTAVGDVFHPDDTSDNPDSVALDRGTLIVNPTDDKFVKQRETGGPLPPHAPDGKCRRSPLISSTARLFPVRPARDAGKL